MLGVTYSYKKTVRTTSADGKVVEEVVEQSSGPEAKAKMDETAKAAEGVEKTVKDTFARMDRFFAKLGEAFKEL